MNRFFFWQQWLFYSSLLFALFGVVFALYGANPLFIPYNKALAHVFWQQQRFPENAGTFRAFIWGPLGGTIACCYILLAFIAKYPFAKKEKWAYWATVVAFGIWILIDSSVAVWYGVYFQAYLINAFSFVVKALPLVFTWKDFLQVNSENQQLPGIVYVFCIIDMSHKTFSLCAMA